MIRTPIIRTFHNSNHFLPPPPPLKQITPLIRTFHKSHDLAALRQSHPDLVPDDANVVELVNVVDEVETNAGKLRDFKE